MPSSEAYVRFQKVQKSYDGETLVVKNLNLDIRLFFINLDLGGLAVIQSALANTLATVTAPVDQLLYNVLLVLGVKIGEADVRVTDVRCQQPALVQ